MTTLASLMGNTYIISDVTSASQQAILTESDAQNECNVIIDNTLGTTSVFVTSGLSSTTAVYPASASVPLRGRVVGAGTVQSWAKPKSHKYIAAIRESGTADVAVMLSTGE